MSAISPQVGHPVAGPPGFGVGDRPVYRGGSASSAIPANAIYDRAGSAIVDRAGNYIVTRV